MLWLGKTCHIQCMVCSSSQQDFHCCIRLHFLLLHFFLGFLFGYEDELACITDFTPNDPDSDDVEDDDWGDDDWDDDEAWSVDDNNDTENFLRYKRDIPSYRDPSGKCLWGILRDLNNTDHETIR